MNHGVHVKEPGKQSAGDGRQVNGAIKSQSSLSVSRAMRSSGDREEEEEEETQTECIEQREFAEDMIYPLS